MQDAIDFTLNGTAYWAAEYNGGFGWSNSRTEESTRFFATLAEAQQDALGHEGGRKERTRVEAEAEEDAERYAREQRHGRNGDVL